MAYPDALVEAHPAGEDGSFRGEVTGLLLSIREVAPRSRPMDRSYTQDVVIPYEFEFRALAARHPCELYLAGASANGETIIERWDLPPQRGGYHTSRTTAPQGVGRPAALSELVGRLVGLVYLPPERREPLVPQRTAVFRGELPGAMRAMAVDPEGRFLLVLTEGGELLQLTDLTSPSISQRFDDTTLPGLARTEIVRPFVDGEGVRCYQVRGRPWDEPQAILILRDLDNDGHLDEIHSLDGDHGPGSPFAPERWKNDYRRYRFFGEGEG